MRRGVSGRGFGRTSFPPTRHKTDSLHGISVPPEICEFQKFLHPQIANTIRCSVGVPQRRPCKLLERIRVCAPNEDQIRSKSPKIGRIRVEFVQNGAEPGRIRSNSAAKRAQLMDEFPESTNIGPNLTKSGPSSAQCRPNSTNFGRHPPRLARLRQHPH